RREPLKPRSNQYDTEATGSTSAKRSPTYPHLPSESRLARPWQQPLRSVARTSEYDRILKKWSILLVRRSTAAASTYGTSLRPQLSYVTTIILFLGALMNARPIVLRNAKTRTDGSPNTRGRSRRRPNGSPGDLIPNLELVSGT